MCVVWYICGEHQVPAELIQLEPGSIGRLKPAASRGGGAEAEGEGEGEVGAGKKKRKSKVRGKDKALQRQKRREELARVRLQRGQVMVYASVVLL